MLVLFLICLAPSLLTIFLPRRWLLAWLPLLGGATLWLLHGLGGADGPGTVVAYAFVGMCLFINLPAAAARLLFVAAALNAEMTRGYCD